MVSRLLFLLFLVVAVACKNKATIAAMVPEKYTEWKSDSTGIRFLCYPDSDRKKIRLLAFNEANDTILKYSGKKQRAVREFYKLNGQYILKVNNAYLNDKFQEVGSARPSGDAFFVDSLYYYKVDTVTHRLNRIPRLSDNEIISLAKKKYKLDGNFRMIHSPVSKWSTIAKDTLAIQQVYYQISTLYELKESDNELIVMPRLQGIYKKGIYNNGATFYEDRIGCTGVKYQPLDKCIFTKSYYRFTDSLSYDNFQQLEKVEIVAYSSIDKQAKILLTLPKNKFPTLDTTYEINANGFILSEVRIDLFKAGGEYFFTTFLPEEGEFMEKMPTVYHILPNWTVEVVTEISNSEKEVGFSDNLIVISEDDRNRANYLTELYKIAKTDLGYRLINNLKK